MVSPNKGLPPLEREKFPRHSLITKNLPRQFFFVGRREEEARRTRRSLPLYWAFPGISLFVGATSVIFCR